MAHASRTMLNVVRRSQGCTSCAIFQSHTRGLNSTGARVKITLPQKMLEHLQRNKEKVATRRRQEQRHYKGPVLIRCKRKEFNHHKGQTYSNFTPQSLASGGWKNSKSKGDHFTLNAFEKNPALQPQEDEIVTFGDLGIQEQLVAALKAMGITSPTNIQAKTIPHMLGLKNILCAAETGSGKTLAYMLPVIQKMQRLKQQYESHYISLNQPYSIILTPSRELADQLERVAHHLAEHVPFHVHSVCGGRGTKKLVRECKVQPVDMLIATPGVLSKLFTNRVFDSSRLHHIVLDEADTLLDDSFSSLTIRLLHKFKIQSGVEDMGQDVSGQGSQVALVGATMPRSLHELLQDIVPVESIEKVTTKSLHRLLPHVPQKFMRMGNDDKPELLLKLLQTNVKRNIPTIVFCNTAGTAFFLHNFLTDNKVRNIHFSAHMAEKVRNGRFEQFQDGEVDILISTDIASRGLDTIRAQHVINYDFPDFMSDYIHRVGRVGRVGSKTNGFALSFVSRKWEVDLLWRIEAAARQVKELHNVNANIKRKLVAMAERKAEAMKDTESPRLTMPGLGPGL